MQRVLPSGEIAASVPRPIPRIRLPERKTAFARRAVRLRYLAAGHAIGDYLRLMAALAEAQQAALDNFHDKPFAVPGRAAIDQARAHRMPLLPAAGNTGDERWINILVQLCGAVAAQAEIPQGVRAVCARLREAPRSDLHRQAEALLAARDAEIDVAGAPFVMTALQVCWVDVASRLTSDDIPSLDVAGVCPICGSLPVASIVRTGAPYDGYRYLHCALCATEWHMVRVKCSHCDATGGIDYHLIDGGSEAVRAESCEQCHSYRKILYQEKDPNVEPVADDLASIALDLLMSGAGYHRASANPLLRQRAGA